jgi:PAS domain S-box-containing protein
MATPSTQHESPHSPTLVDDVYEWLKKHDPEWLAVTLNERRNEIVTTSKDRDGEVAASTSSPLLADSQNQNEPPRNRIIESAWPYDDILQKHRPQREVSAHIQLIRSRDWASTDLGPVSSWSVELQRIVSMCMLDPRPAAVWWRKSRSIIYNEGYAAILGKRHPAVLGQRFKEAWPELVGSFDQHFDKAEETGKSVSGDNAFFLTERNGYSEELWASWSITPIAAGHNDIGFYNAVFETTKQVLSERRMSTIMLLGRCTSAAKNTHDLFKQAVRALEPNHYDIPFAAVYAAASPDYETQRSQSTSDHRDSVPEDLKSMSDHSSVFSDRQWTLEGMLGLPTNCSSLPSRIDSEVGGAAITSLFNEIIATGKITLLRTEDGTFPKGLQGVAKSRAFGDDCTSAVLCPVGPTNRENVLGFVLIGINPRHAYDDDYKTFINILSRQMATSIASVVLTEEELRRTRFAAELATQDRIRLSEQLAVTKQEAEASEVRFRRMTELSPVAMFHFDELGNVLYANQTWFDLTQHPRDSFHPLSWYNVIHEGDHALMDQEWAKLTAGDPVHFELRLKRPFETDEALNGESIRGETWILASAYAEKAEDGTVKGILGCLTDISRHKWAEGFQARRTEEAVELKRQQENFMDMTSHEARNPLSAMMLCAESILNSLQDLLNTSDGRDHLQVTKDTIETNLEGAEIIMACAQHQKRIIDDVLTLSKLDAGLLVICPIECQPDEIIKQALKMFDSELLKSDIQLEYTLLPTYSALGIDWVRLDPSRLLQILINLLTNAIKFTTNCKTRKITLTVGASTERPNRTNEGIEYLADPSPKDSSSTRAEDEVYLSVTVKDTGRGIAPDEMKSLFQRFMQASPKTYIKYGGSGLGLFISRELASRQGGRIGVASEPGVGSTFAFYVQSHICSPPKTHSKIPRPVVEHSTGSRRRTHSTTSVITAAATVEVQLQSHIKHEIAILKAPEPDSVATKAVHLLVVEGEYYAGSTNAQR